jgi:DNA invertase Pin-like site-specific DNA recombinase
MQMMSKSSKPRTGHPSCIIYCRVSTSNQANGSSVSLEAQESISKKIAKTEGYRIKMTCKEVKSAYSSSMKSLREILTANRNTHIIMYDVSRFCRNVVKGKSMIDIALVKNNTLVFVNDKLVINKKNKIETMPRFLKLLEQSENESKRIGSNIRTAQRYLRDQGKYAGGSVPFGQAVLKTDDDDNRTLIADCQEQNIISFIRLCRMKEISSAELNQLMNTISKQIPYLNINCYDKDQETILHTINTALTYTEIANLLNEYSVKKRGREWTSSSVSTTKLDPFVEFQKSKMNVFAERNQEPSHHFQTSPGKKKKKILPYMC